MEYVMYGKLLTHLREHRMRQSSFFNFSKDGAEAGETLTSKDLTKFAYGVAKGMEYLVSKGVSESIMTQNISYCFNIFADYPSRLGSQKYSG